MTHITNKQNSDRVKFWMLRAPFFLVLVILVLTVFEFLSSIIFLIVSASVLLACIIAVLALKLQFVDFKIDQGRIEIRYYNIFPLTREYRIIEIEAGTLERFDTKSSFSDLVYVLLLFKETPKGPAAYPFVSLTLFSKTERKSIVNVLTSLT